MELKSAHAPKTAKPIHLEQDLQNIVNTFDEAELPINNNLVKDFFRLQTRCSTSSTYPCQIFKISRCIISSLQRQFIQSTYPDLTPEERKIENYLLKERWSLIQLGFERKRIKLWNKNIFIDNKLYGQYLNFEFQCTQYNPPLNTANLSPSAHPDLQPLIIQVKINDY